VGNQSETPRLPNPRGNKIKGGYPLRRYAREFRLAASQRIWRDGDKASAFLVIAGVQRHGRPKVVQEPYARSALGWINASSIRTARR
jgi:hypothetical protein